MKTICAKLLLIGLVSLTLLLFIGCGGDGGAEQPETDAEADSTAENDSTAASKDTTAASDDTTDTDLDLIPVEVADVYTGEISSYLQLSSTIETEEIVDVYPLVNGIIEEIFVEEGMFVQQDQPLLQLEDDEIILTEKQAEVDYEQQKAAFQRLEQMHSQQLISDEEFERARFTFQQAEIQRDRTRLTRERTLIRSPISGVIAERLVYLGNLVNTTNKLFIITDPTEKICRIWVPERDLYKLAVGQKAFITSEIALQDRFPGWIKRISPIVDPMTGTCKVTVGVKDRKNQLRNGIFVRAEVVIDTHADATLVSKSALIYENDLEWVYMIRDTIAVRQRVKIGFANGNRFEALEGLDPGDQVVVVGQSTLKDSTGIRVVSLDSTLTMALSQDQSD